MKQYKTRAIIIRKQNFSETDRLLTVYSYDYGKIKILAKGVKKTLSKLSGHLELFYITDLVVSKGKNLDIITSANFINKFTNIENTKNTNCAAYYISELIYLLCEEAEKNPQIFELLTDTLARITDENYIRIINFFEIKLFQKLGHQPEIDGCVVCHNKGVSSNYFFNYEEGGLVCQKCSLGKNNNIKLLPNDIKLLKIIKNKNIEFLLRIKISSNNISNLAKCIASMRTDIIGRDLKSANFL